MRAFLLELFLSTGTMKLALRLTFACSLLTYFTCCTATRPVVSLAHGGKLEGILETTLKGRSVNAFLGIPYGTAERFQSPKSADAWVGVRDAGSPSPYCLQYNLLATADPVRGVEDCLFLDVITPKLIDTNSSSLLPVVVLIPAGSFTSFGASTYGAKFLLDTDVVYVAINSRVGILGYLSTEDDVIAGNWGLKDQALALRWVQDNIQRFGGDPARVTLVGESSGACSVHLHYFAPSSRGLFNRGVALSGSAGNYWAQAAVPRRKAQQLAASLNCSDTSTSENILECLLNADGNTLTALYEQFNSYTNSPFAPVVEPETVEGAFLTKTPLSLLALGEAADLPLVTSTLAGEGLLPGARFLASPESLTSVDNNWNQLAPLLLEFQDSVDSSLRESVSTTIREHYFSNGSIDVAQLIELLGDRSIVSDTVYTTLLQAHHNSAPVYALRFNYFGSANSGQLLGATLDQLKPYGPAHGDDVAYLYNTTYLTTANTEQDLEVIQAMVEMVTSFAITGTPAFNTDTTWEPVSKSGLEAETLNYLQLNSGSDLEVKSSTNLGDFRFWQSLPLREPAAKRAQV